MPRRIRSAQFETRTARLKLPIAKRPHDFTEVSPGISLGYRRCKSAGRWVARVADGHGGSWEKTFALADDHEDADGEHVLDFWQAAEAARRLARSGNAGAGAADSSRPGTVAEAIDDYEKDLIARNAGKANARRAEQSSLPRSCPSRWSMPKPGRMDLRCCRTPTTSALRA